MPDSWIFTGINTFALLGPIVPSNMIPYYRSELLMTAPPDNLRENRAMESADNARGTSSTAALMTGAAGQTAAQKRAALETAAARQRKHGTSEASSVEGTTQMQ